MVADISSRSWPDLMAGMAGEHGAAARLRHVADQEPRPADLGAAFGQALDVLDEGRMSPVAIARKSHDLPVRAVDRQRFCAREAAVGVEAEHLRLELRRRGPAAEQFLGGVAGIVGMSERRQRLGIERAFVLRLRHGGGKEGDGKRQRHQHALRQAGARPRFSP